jgi:hypothetical protein
MVRQHIHARYWRPDEDVVLLELVRAGKSWVLISAKLGRTMKQAQDRHRMLVRRLEQAGRPS